MHIMINVYKYICYVAYNIDCMVRGHGIVLGLKHRLSVRKASCCRPGCRFHQTYLGVLSMAPFSLVEMPVFEWQL